EGDSADFFCLYMAPGHTEDMHMFFVYWDSRGKDSLIRKEDGYFITYVPVQPGQFSFFMTAINRFGESPRTPILFRNYGPNQEIRIDFTSQPVLTGFVNINYSYQVTATASNGDTIKYSLIQPPPGMTIDENTGLINWMPARPGCYPISIKARDKNIPNIFNVQNYVLVVFKCNTYTGITGTISFDNGDSVGRGIVEVWIKTDAPQLKPFINFPFEHGIFNLKLDEGTYYLHFTGDNFNPEWWQDKLEMRDADSISLSCGDSLNFDIKVAPKSEPIRITFLSKPPLDAYVNEVYSYQVQAFASDSEALKYELINPPDGMTIDPDTGLLLWTPSIAGGYQIAIKASLANSSNVFNIQSYILNVKKCRGFSGISGTITDQIGKPVPAGMVEVYIRTNDSLGYRLFADCRFEHGNYKVTLDQGTYLLHFTGDNFIPEWWENVSEMKDATPIDISCGDSMIVNVTVQVQAPEVMFTVTGSVVKDTDNTPLPFANVQFFGRNKRTNEIKDFKTWSDDHGNYQIRLSNRFSYIALCEYMDSTQGSDSQLIPQYYNKVTDPADADIIDLNGDTTGINFSLQEVPPLNNDFGGIVKGTDSIPLPGAHVIAFRVGPGPWQQIPYLYISRTTITDDNGNFSFHHLIPGKYVVMIFIEDRQYIPGYYRLNTPLVRSWREATQINVPVDGSGGTIIAIVMKRNSVSGNGGCKGSVKGDGGIIKAGGNVPLNTHPIRGAVVYILNSQSQVVNFAFSDQSGNYEIYDLNKGNYTLQVDKVGYYSYTDNFSLANDTTFADKSVDLTSGNFLAVNDNNTVISAIQVYPNPATNEINVQMPVFRGAVSVDIINSLGNVISTSIFNSDSGLGIYTINTQNLVSGVYFLKLTAGNDISTISFRIIK
ncbi:MAG: carboxypeptidase regulatory-like domain-containing protein, partial [FCB group bacterium]